MKHFTKKLALLTLLAGMCGSAWAQVTTTLIEYGTGESTAWNATNLATWTAGGSPTITNGYVSISGGNGSYETSKAISPTADAILNVEAVWRGRSDTGRTFAQGNGSYFRFGNIVVAQNDQDQKHGYVFTGLNNIGSVTTFTVGSYRTDITNLPFLKITMEINTAKNTLNSFSIKSEDGKTTYVNVTNVSLSTSDYTTVAFGYYKSGRVSTTNTEHLKSIKITQTTQPSVKKADYTINYIYNNQTIKTIQGNATVGSTIEAENPITIDDVKYYAVDGSTMSMELVEGTNTLEITLRQADTFSYTVVNNFGETITEGSVVEGESDIFAYPEYIEIDGTLYKTSLRNATGDGNFLYKISPTADGEVLTIDYSEAVTNVVFFAEAEDILGGTPNNESNANIRCSNAYGAYFGNDVTVTTLPAGLYKATVQVWGNTGTTFNINAGENTILEAATVGYLQTYTSEEFTLTKETDIIVPAAGSKGKVIDYVYIVKTGDVVPGTLAAGKYATRIFPFTPTVPSGVKFYSCAALNGNSLTLTEVSAPEANKPYILENTTGADIDITQAGVDTHEADTYDDGLLTGVFANTEITSGYVLQTQNEKQSFFKVADPITVPPFRAYLNYSAAVKSIGFDSTTAINTLEVLANGAYEGIYTADGVKLNRIEKGVNILKMADGTTRKVIVK